MVNNYKSTNALFTQKIKRGFDKQFSFINEWAPCNFGSMAYRERCACHNCDSLHCVEGVEVGPPLLTTDDSERDLIQSVHADVIIQVVVVVLVVHHVHLVVLIK